MNVKRHVDSCLAATRTSPDYLTVIYGINYIEDYRQTKVSWCLRTKHGIKVPTACAENNKTIMIKRKNRNDKSKTLNDRKGNPYNIPSIKIAPKYNLTLRIVVNIGSVASSGPYNVVLTPALISRLALDQITNSIVLNTGPTTAFGNIPLVPTSTNVIYSFVRIKHVRAWGISGGQIAIRHLVSNNTILVTIPATPVKDSQSTGFSSKPYDTLPFPNVDGHAYPAAATGDIIRVDFSGYQANTDNTVIIDTSVVLFD